MPTTATFASLFLMRSFKLDMDLSLAFLAGQDAKGDVAEQPGHRVLAFLPANPGDAFGCRPDVGRRMYVRCGGVSQPFEDQLPGHPSGPPAVVRREGAEVDHEGAGLPDRRQA